MAPLATAAEPPPNIVYFLVDDLGREDCGFMGGQEIRTPRIDQLATAGARLDAYYVQPVCSPTRAAIMTGRYPMRLGLQVGVIRPWADYGLPLEERTLADALHEAGYATAICGKWHLGEFQPAYLPTRRGFDLQYGCYLGAIDCFQHDRDGGFDWHKNDQACRDEGYSTHLLAREAVKFVGENAGKKPFFLYLPFNAVHSPLQSPDSYTQPYAQLKGARRAYAGMLAAVDEAIGQVVDAVDKAGVRNQTLFLFSSDNGGPSPGVVTSNGPYRAGKATLYEGGVRVAAFASWTGKIQPGQTIREPMHAVDLFPTLTKLAGVKSEPRRPLDGVDVWPVLASGQPRAKSEILLNVTPTGGALRSGDWKLVLAGDADAEGEGDEGKAGAEKKKAGKKQGGRDAVELFNLREDPYEKTNLADKHADKVQELRAKLAQYAGEAVPPKGGARPAGFQAPKVWGERK